MSTSRQNNLVSQIETLLEKEHKALVSGELDTLVKLTDQKQKLIDALSAAPLENLTSLQTLQAKALRNQAMLDSATRGIKTVANRLSTLQKVRRSLETYDAQGQKRTIRSACNATLEKRA